MKKLLWALAAFSLAWAGTSYADVLSGQIKDIDTGGNALTLTSPRADTGEQTEYKVVWDDDLQQAIKLENAKVGERLSVHADQNMFTRNWKVKAIA